nr:hypothetical protein [Tanacetum cinerariifolium]
MDYEVAPQSGISLCCCDFGGVIVKFGNDHVEKIMGYGDYQIGNVTISRVYSVEGLGHNLFSVRQFWDSDLEVAFRDMMAFSSICFLSKASKTKSWLWHQSLSHLNFGAINHLARQGLVRGLPKLKFEKDHLCYACAMVKSKKKSHKPKSKDTNQEKLYLLHMDLCGPMCVESVNVGISHETSLARSPQQNGVIERRNHTLIEAAHTMLIYEQASLFLWAEAVASACYTQNRSFVRLHHGKTPYELLHGKLPNLSRIIETIHFDFDELTAISSEQSSSGPALYEMTPATISSGLSLLPQAPEVIALIAEVVALEPAESTGSPSSTTVNQDAPSPIKCQTTPKTPPPVIPNDVEEDNHDIKVAHMGNDPFFGMPILKDHPLENIIDQLARPVSTRLQLHEQALFCYYDAFLTSVEPKMYKDALTQSCWIEAMQEEINEFERLRVCELVPQPDNVMVITLKWIYKVKLDELG